MTRLSRFLLLAGTAFALPLAANATVTPLTLSGPINGNSVGPESASNPCIIAGTTCPNQTGMGYNNFSANGSLSTYNMFSTDGPNGGSVVADGVQGTPYTVGQLAGVMGTHVIDVAIDVNTTGAASERLDLFEVYIGGTNPGNVAYTYNGGATGTLIGNVNNNGNGWADWTLGKIDLSAYADNTTVLFHAEWHNAVDGAESFFLVKDAPDPVPEPTSIALLGVGLLGLGFVTAKRRN